jgi:hypothetical protein
LETIEAVGFGGPFRVAPGAQHGGLGEASSSESRAVAFTSPSKADQRGQNIMRTG